MARSNEKGRIGKASRQAAAEVVRQVLFEGVYIDQALASQASEGRFDARDRGLIRAISGTTLRRLGQIRNLLATHMKKPLAPKFASASCVLYTCVAQTCFMNIPNHAAIDIAVDILRGSRKHRHLAAMANAVLRKISDAAADTDREPDDIRINTPKWLWQLWAKDFGKASADNIARAHLGEAELDITLKPGADVVPEGIALPNASRRLASGLGRIESLPGYEQGNWWVQDFAASLPAGLFGDIAGKSALDLCAAPGGKTLQLAAVGAQVTALDISEHRLQRVSENLTRVGLEAKIECADVLKWQCPHQHDAVLLDAPCSATGTIRRHPDAPYLKKSSDIDILSKLQATLLARAASFVKPQGLLIYCTCSLQKREGEDQIESFLQRNDHFERLPVKAGEVGGLSHILNNNGDVRTLPFHDVGGSTGMDGFFISRLRRKS